MNDRSHLKKLSMSFIGMLFCLVMWITPAHAISDGCTQLDMPPYSNNYNWTKYDFTAIFYPGDEISWELSGNAYARARIYNVITNVYLKDSDTAPNDNIGSVTIPTLGEYKVYLIAQENPALGVPRSIQASCTIKADNPTSSPNSEEGEENEDDIPTFVTPPDARINWQYGDTNAIMFAHEDGVTVHCVGDSTSWLAAHINQALIESADTSQPQEVPVYRVDENGCRVAFYILDSGEYQVNIWSNEGKIYEIIDDSISFENAIMRYYDPNE